MQWSDIQLTLKKFCTVYHPSTHWCPKQQQIGTLHSLAQKEGLIYLAFLEERKSLGLNYQHSKGESVKTWPNAGRKNLPCPQCQPNQTYCTAGEALLTLCAGLWVRAQAHWRQTQPLLRSNRAGVRWLSHLLWTRREESPAQRKVGGIAVKTSLDQLFVQYKCTVMDEINGHYLQLP